MLDERYWGSKRGGSRCAVRECRTGGYPPTPVVLRKSAQAVDGARVDGKTSLQRGKRSAESARSGEGMPLPLGQFVCFTKDEGCGRGNL